MTILLHKYDWDWDEDAENTHSKYEQLVEEMPQQVAKEFLHKYPNAVDGIHLLNKKLEEIQNSRFQAAPYDLLEAIAEADLSYATSMCQLLIQQPDLLLASHLTPLLSKIRLNAPDHALDLIQRALTVENLALWSAIARIYLGRDWAKEFRAEDYTFIKNFLNHLDLNIRHIAIMSLSRLGYFHPQPALSLALSVNLEDSRELASELYQLFTFNPGINPDILAAKHLEELLSKLVHINNIDDYWIERFLSYASERVPDSVLKLLLNRIEKDMEDSEGRYQPLPYGKLKYNLRLSEDEKSRELLRNIRDLSLSKSYSVGLLLAEIFRVVLSSVTALSLTVLNEWVSSQEPSKVQAVSLLLRAMPQTFAFTQVKFLENLLEQAYELGDECYEITSNNLFDALMMGSRGGTIGQPCQKDVDIREQSSAIASQLLAGSPAYKFYSSLAKYAEANIARQIALGEAHME